MKISKSYSLRNEYLFILFILHLDTEPPRFKNQSQCKDGFNIRKETLPGKSYAVVNFNEVQATDNSGDTPIITCEFDNGTSCEYEMGESYKITYTKTSVPIMVTFKATDRTGLFSSCRFNVFVLGLSNFYKVFLHYNIPCRTKKCRTYFSLN